MKDEKPPTLEYAPLHRWTFDLDQAALMGYVVIGTLWGLAALWLVVMCLAV